LFSLVQIYTNAYYNVGETSQTLRGRFNLHRSSINNKNKAGFCKRLCDHFHQGVKNASYTVQIIEKLEGNGRNNDDKVDLNIAAIRRKKKIGC